MDGTRRLAHRARCSTAAASRSRPYDDFVDIIRRARRARPAGRGPRHRRPGQPRGARRLRGHARRVGAARACARASSTRSCSHPDDVARFAAARRHRVRPVQPRAVRPRPRRPRLGGHDRPRLRLPRRCSTRARAWPTAPTRRSRSSTRSPACAPGSSARSTTAPAWHPEQRIPLEAALRADHRRTRPGWRATSTAAAASSPASPPTSSSSTATPSTDLAGAQVVATMVGGQWTHGPYDV